MTYSIVARDGDGRMGVAVQTCVMGVGAICPWGRAGVGVVATQAFSLAGYGPRLLDRLAAGESPAAALGVLAAADERRDQRQVAVLASDGATAAFTGSDTIPFAGDVQGDGFSCQANMMAAPGVPEAMRDAFVASDGPLRRRLLAALRAEAAGFRGRQSAALLVVEADVRDESWGVAVDVRVGGDRAARPAGTPARRVRGVEAMRPGTAAARARPGRTGGWRSARPHWRRTTRAWSAGWRCCGARRRPEPLRDLIGAGPAPGTCWTGCAHDEVQLSDDVMGSCASERSRYSAAMCATGR
jgi:uncharacterized Ntn-hydrolase superfamily protein